MFFVGSPSTRIMSASFPGGDEAVILVHTHDERWRQVAMRKTSAAGMPART